MYQASEAFHDAVRRGEPQKALLIFPDRVFTNDDIDVQNGIEFDDNFNMEEDLAIGQATSNELRFSLFNPDWILNDYEFGEFTATLGARIHREPTDERVVCMAVKDNVTWIGSRNLPYLTRNGSALGTQPAHPVTSILIADGKVYAFGNGNVTVYSMSGTPVNETVCDFMKRKAEKHWIGCGYVWMPESRLLEEWKGGYYQVYEFVPLGIFIAERPDVPSVIRIDFTCNDRMLKFDKDFPGIEAIGLAYPFTIGSLLTKLCQYYEIPMRVGQFINDQAEVSKSRAPEAFENITSRKVIQWIAEAACSNARIDREGYLILDWIRTTEQVIDEHGYMDVQPVWYTTPTIDKLYNRNTTGDTETTFGSGEVGYLIQDNPLLNGAT